MIEQLKNSLIGFFNFSADEPWLFTRLSFWIFFSIMVGIYSLFYRKYRIRNIYLLLISLFFYYKTGGWFTILLLFSCVLNYTWGYFIGLSKRKFYKTFGLITGLILNLGILFYFKYAYFFTGILNQLFADEFETYNWLAQWWNTISGSNIDTTDIILPVGISFFTFQAISYLVDVYKGRSEVVKNVFDFSFYLSFFPQLVAGPIVRASAFIPQLYRNYHLTKQEFGHALFLILAGLVKKIVISDYLAVNFIDRVFDQPGSFSGVENLMAVYAYALQIYCDFSGYTDIAIGVALMLGFKLPLNFNSPYKAISLTDFWHRWHISLSTWLRDYLFIPLGGSKKGKIRTTINLLFTMLLGGLWHGANLKFILWGGFHGLGLVFEKMLNPLWKKIPNNLFFRMISVFIIFQIVCAGWLIFRANSINAVKEMLNQIIYSFHFVDLIDFTKHYLVVFVVMIIGFSFHWMPARLQEYFRGMFIQLPILMKGIVVLATLLLINYFLLADIRPFIYFRF